MNKKSNVPDRKHWAKEGTWNGVCIELDGTDAMWGGRAATADLVGWRCASELAAHTSNAYERVIECPKHENVYDAKGRHTGYRLAGPDGFANLAEHATAKLVSAKSGRDDAAADLAKAPTDPFRVAEHISATRIYDDAVIDWAYAVGQAVAWIRIADKLAAETTRVFAEAAAESKGTTQ